MMIRILLPPLAILLLLAAPIESPEAKPKKTYNGCTQQQLQTPEAGQCLNNVTGDLLQGRTYTHVVYCDSGGHIQCCLQDNQTGQTLDASCETMTLRAHPEAINPKTKGGVLMSP